jgi:hypothetical protein
MHYRNVFPRERSRTLFFLLAWHEEGALSFCEAKGGWLIVYLETKGTGKPLAQIVYVLCSKQINNVLPLNKRCLPCYENSSVVIYHVGG